jgi:hypothetical protein
MKRMLILALLVAGGIVMTDFAAQASGPPQAFYGPATVFFEDFEDNDNVLEYDHLFTSHEAEIGSDNAISGEKSLTTYVVNPPGQWVDTLSIKKDFTQLSSANAFLVTGKIQTSNYQQMMVEVRKNYDGNTVDNMPYEFILTIDETSNTIGRPCYNGWYNACTTLPIHNEIYTIDPDGVISFAFEFVSDEPVVFSFRGVVKNTAEVAVMTFDDLSISEKPVMTEDFEVVVGNFWEATAFWANAGGIETDPAKIISGNQSLRYDINDWVLGGITNTKFNPPQNVPIRLSFDVRADNGKVFLLATPWSPLYFEFQYDFETGILSSPGLTSAEAILQDGILHVEMEFTIPTSGDLQTFNFYGSKLDTEQPGSYVIDNIAFEVLEKAPIVIPEFNVGYAITKTPAMAYRTNLMAEDVLGVKDGEGIPLETTDYTVTDFGFAFDNAYLDALGANIGLSYTLETTYGEVPLTVDIYDVRPAVTPDALTYQKSLQQDVILDIDLVEHDFVSVELDDVVLDGSAYSFDGATMVIDAASFLALEDGAHTLTVTSKGGHTVVPVTIEAGLPAFDGSPYGYTAGSGTDLEVTTPLGGAQIDLVTIAGTPVPEESLTVSDGVLTFSSDFLDTLPAGLSTVTVDTVTEGVSFTFDIDVTVSGPTTGQDQVSHDVYPGSALDITVDLQGLPLGTVTLDGTDITASVTYDTGTLSLDPSVFDGLALGTHDLVITTTGGSLPVTITLENTAGLNDVIDITVPSTPIQISKGASYDPLEDISHTGAQGDVTVTLSDHLDVDVPGRYVVTVVVEDIQDNVSFSHYTVVVTGGSYTVTISYQLLTQERGVIDEAILDFGRKSPVVV